MVNSHRFAVSVTAAHFCAGVIFLPERALSETDRLNLSGVKSLNSLRAEAVCSEKAGAAYLRSELLVID